MKINPLFLQYSKGDVAQLEEHHNGIVGVVGSNPIISSFFLYFIPRWCNGSTEVFGTFSWSSNLYRGTSFAAGLKPVVERFFAGFLAK